MRRDNSAMATLDPGKVVLDLGAGRAAVRCRRPAAAGLLRGQPAEPAVAMIPLWFSICGKAQGAAARLALAAARGEATAPRQDRTVAAEATGEHLWRLLLDWPRLLVLPTEEALFVAARRRLLESDFPAWAAEALRPAVDRVFAALAGLAEPSAPAAARLPVISAEASLGFWPRLDEAFAAAPVWQGRPAETGALARLPVPPAAGPILARVQARWVETLAPAGGVSAVPVAPGVGRALVETARGLLMHEIRLDGDRIGDYVIVAPTEWNFHPEGTLAAWLRDLPPAEAASLAPRALLALDACVPTEVNIAVD